MQNLSKNTDINKLLSAKLYILDMDGTLYLGDEVFEGAVEFIHFLEKQGINYVYLTNNSSRAGKDYITRLTNMGFPCKKENIFTSSMACGIYLKKNFENKKVYIMGTKAFEQELLNDGVIPVADGEDADVVCVGFDTELVYEKLNKAVHHLRRGAKFIAANPDLVCPMPNDEVLPDCGSICKLLTASSGVEPFYIGKPNRSMIDLLAEKWKVKNENIICVGDRLYTDIKVAENAGALSVCLLSGESTKESINLSEVKPDFLYHNIKSLLEDLKKRY